MFLWKDQWTLFERKDKLIISEIKELKLLIDGHQKDNKVIVTTTLCPQFW